MMVETTIMTTKPIKSELSLVRQTFQDLKDLGLTWLFIQGHGRGIKAWRNYAQTYT